MANLNRRITDKANIDVTRKSALYRCIYDPKETQIGHALKYFPWHALSVNLQRMIHTNEGDVLSREQLERATMDCQTKLFLEDTEWQIVWRNNAIPTVTEWLKMELIYVEFRVTPLHGCVAILHKAG